MSPNTSFAFQKKVTGSPKVIVSLCGTDLKLPEQVSEKFENVQNTFEAAAKAADFNGKAKTQLNLFVPAGTEIDRLIILGVGDDAETSIADWTKLGGRAAGMLKNKDATVVLGDCGADNAAAFAEGVFLRNYNFDIYKTKSKDDDKKPSEQNLVIVCSDVSDARDAWDVREAVAEGTVFARTLVNEPANILTTTEFAKRLKSLEKLGVEVEVLDERDLKKIGMNALLAVGVGSAMPSKVVVMKWNGGNAKDKPLAFVGKGVVFDTGGISIKPAGGMEDMKGDMGGAAAVSGLMKAVAGRKAKANIVGIVGLVENMPDGLAQRPGDIVTSLSGQTIEVINTDAEGRLVLADLLWYTEDTFKPKFMINLATLTGAVIVALGHHHAGMFSNSDDLCDALTSAGKTSAELVWRLPLGKPYDKMIDSKFADMKNTGGRSAGSITAAQFLQRYVRDVDWAHLDIAGTAMGSPQTDINKSWSSGFGVNLLNQLVADKYEG
ncbi:MAG: leucyl aminopeptidase [Hyphomicrobiales bacterium]|nr:MAG: leucyl aminopeptidase [Hyphomicrobiales bacterium]